MSLAKKFLSLSYGCTALHYAVDNSQKELINFALECRANIEERDNNGWTPLLRGVYLGSETSALSELIQKGACVNVCDVRGQTPLMQAVLTNNGDSISVIKLLLSAGAEIKVFNKYNNTALLMANAHHDYVVVEELITSLQIDKDGFENEILSKIIGNGKNCEVATALTEPIQVIKE
ncbi:serine/threonine-protein phosphatase 6 regulatory ankyrin repeat subunit C-like isoform X2 [Lycorma delicatula]|uniref:serine/threonine-protein phosphatase 6 regulatory ankyrin repeat subunit C-like isoform X2 n=1 Tax=Lycorma delicatula TaxID=130591 RepID=UPI003F513008